MSIDTQAVAVDPASTLRAKAVAGMLGVSVRTVYWWTQLGRFPKSFKLGPRTTVWPRQDVVEWLKRKEGEQVNIEQR